MRKFLTISLYCILVFTLASCVGLEGEPQISKPDGPPPKLTAAQMLLIEPFIGEWGFRSCADQRALRERCNRRHLIVARNGTMTIEVPNQRSTALASSSSLYMVPVSKNVLENRSNEGFIRLTLAKEGGVTVLKYHAEVGKARLSQKYLSVADLRRGYSIDNIKTNPRVAFYGSARGNGTGVSSANASTLASVTIGDIASSISLSGQCGLPRSKVTQAERRKWYNEATKALSFGNFQSDQSARAEINSLSTPSGFNSVCEAVAKQVYLLLPSLNQAIASSDRLHNGSPLGLQCPGTGGASVRTACQATQIVYTIKLTSFMCHHVCNK